MNDDNLNVEASTEAGSEADGETDDTAAKLTDGSNDSVVDDTVQAVDMHYAGRAEAVHGADGVTSVGQTNQVGQADLPDQLAHSAQSDDWVRRQSSQVDQPDQSDSLSAAQPMSMPSSPEVPHLAESQQPQSQQSQPVYAASEPGRYQGQSQLNQVPVQETQPVQESQFQPGYDAQSAPYQPQAQPLQQPVLQMVQQPFQPQTVPVPTSVQSTYPQQPVQQIPQSGPQMAPQAAYPAVPQAQLQPQPVMQPMPMMQPPVQFVPPFNPRATPAWRQYLAKHRSVFSRVGWAIVMAAVVWNVLAEVLMSGIGPLLVHAGMDKTDVETIFNDLPFYCVAIPLTLFIFRTVPKVKRRTVNLKPKQFLTFFSLIFPIMTIGGILGQLVSNVLSGGGASDRLQDATSGGSLWLTLLSTTILAPIFEETFFRKLLIDHLQQYGEKIAILCSALAFGLYHMNFFQFFYATGLGLVMAYIYVRTGKLRYTIAMHILFNTFGGSLNMLLSANMSDKTVDALTSLDGSKIPAALAAGGPAAYAILVLQIFTIVMFFVGIVVAAICWRKLRFHRAPDELLPGSRASVVLGNSGVIATIILLGGMTFLELWL